MNPISETASPLANRPPIASGKPAWDLLLAASLVDATEDDLGRIRSLLDKAESAAATHWETFLRLAGNHGTSSLVYQNLSRVGVVIPQRVIATLRERYQASVHKALFLARELIRILDLLEGRGIAALPYKGIVLSDVYYGDMALRQPGDIDLFVRRQDVPRVKSAVLELGFTEHVPIPPEAEKDFIASGYEFSFDSPAGPSLLELQWALQPRFYAVDFDMQALFDRAVKVDFAGHDISTPSAEDLLLVLSVHAAKHVWERLIWLCDIAQILKREDLNWDWVQRYAGKLGIERILHVTLLLANQLLGAAIPAAIDASIIRDRVALELAEEIGAGLAAGVSYDVQQISYFRLMMRLRERRADRAKFLARLTFTPGPGEWEAVRLPRVLFPFYRVVRLVRLAGRFTRG